MNCWLFSIFTLRYFHYGKCQTERKVEKSSYKHLGPRCQAPATPTQAQSRPTDSSTNHSLKQIQLSSRFLRKDFGEDQNPFRIYQGALAGGPPCPDRCDAWHGPQEVPSRRLMKLKARFCGAGPASSASPSSRTAWVTSASWRP